MGLAGAARVSSATGGTNIGGGSKPVGEVLDLAAAAARAGLAVVEADLRVWRVRNEGKKRGKAGRRVGGKEGRKEGRKEEGKEGRRDGGKEGRGKEGKDAAASAYSSHPGPWLSRPTRHHA